MRGPWGPQKPSTDDPTVIIVTSKHNSTLSLLFFYSTISKGSSVQFKYLFHSSFMVKEDLFPFQQLFTEWKTIKAQGCTINWISVCVDSKYLIGSYRILAHWPSPRALLVELQHCQLVEFFESKGIFGHHGNREWFPWQQRFIVTVPYSPIPIQCPFC